MTNDPNRDLLPVKERCERFRVTGDNLMVFKYKRHELEDRYIRLYEDNNDLKRLTNAQEDKIKKLGTKLLRLIKEHKAAPKLPLKRTMEETSVTEELQLKILELEHENYSLKDKNIVLRQQLASHSKHHVSAHRSPVRPHLSSSPRLINGHAQNINGGSFILSNQHNTSEIAMQDVDAQILSQNDEIKTLQSKIETLQQELDKSIFSNQKGKVGENIELIRLRRISKQMETHVRSLEHRCKLLQQDVTRLQKENESAVQIIAEKQSEIIDLKSLADDVAKIQMECQEARDVVRDLTVEKDNLNERCDILLKTIRENSKESESLRDLKRQLEAERYTNSVLQRELQVLKSTASLFETSMSVDHGKMTEKFKKSDSFTQTNATFRDETNHSGHFPETAASSYNILDQLAKVKLSQGKQDNLSDTQSVNPVSNISSSINHVDLPISTKTLPTELSIIKNLEDGLSTAVDIVKMQRELDYMRDMLRIQTQRCDTQECEILRLKQESKLNEDRYKDVFQQRDLFFRLLDRKSESDGLVQVARNEGVKENNAPSARDGENNTRNSGTYTKNTPKQKSSPAANSRIGSPDGSDKVDEPNSSVLSTATALKVTIDCEKPCPLVPERSPIVVPVPIPRSRTTKHPVPLEPTVITTNIQPLKVEKVELTILWLQLDADGKIMNNQNIRALYVDFTFLNVGGEAFETPQALPKPQISGEKITYDFNAEIELTTAMRETLKTLKENKAQGNVVVFNIVSEPPVDQSQAHVECTVVGTSILDFQQFAFAEPDEEILIPVHDVEKGADVCGTLAVRLNVPPSLILDL